MSRPKEDGRGGSKRVFEGRRGPGRQFTNASNRLRTQSGGRSGTPPARRFQFTSN